MRSSLKSVSTMFRAARKRTPTLREVCGSFSKGKVAEEAHSEGESTCAPSSSRGGVFCDSERTSLDDGASDEETFLPGTCGPAKARAYWRDRRQATCSTRDRSPMSTNTADTGASTPATPSTCTGSISFHLLDKSACTQSSSTLALSSPSRSQGSRQLSRERETATRDSPWESEASSLGPFDAVSERAFFEAARRALAKHRESASRWSSESSGPHPEDLASSNSCAKAEREKLDDLSVSDSLGDSESSGSRCADIANCESFFKAARQTMSDRQNSSSPWNSESSRPHCDDVARSNFFKAARKTMSKRRNSASLGDFESSWPRFDDQASKDMFGLLPGRN